MIQIELKPCPFCGKPAKLGGGDNVDGSPYYYIYCSNIDECGANQFGTSSKEETVFKWNRRAYESSEPTAHA